MFGFKAGMEVFIVNSATNADLAIKEFKRYIEMGYNPNTVSEDVFDSLGINPKEDLTTSDYLRVQNTVEAYWREMYKC